MLQGLASLPALASVQADDKLTASDAVADQFYGLSVAGAGDVDADGYDDVIVGAPGSRALVGAAYLYRGSASGLVGEQILVGTGGAEDDLGWSVAAAGDLDQDGFADVVVGNPGESSAGTDGGGATVYYGSPSGLVALQTLLPGEPEEYGGFGVRLASAGDVDGDGYADLIVGAYGEEGTAGAAYLFAGSVTGLQAGAAARLTASDGDLGHYLGQSVASAGDVDGDGDDEVIIGTATANRAYVYRGSTSGLSASSEQVLTAGDADTYDLFGASVAGGGDLDGDGYDDVVVGSPQVDGAETNAGAAYVFYGSTTGLPLSSSHQLLDREASAYAYLGSAVAVGGDVDGDGFGDVLVGSPGADEDRGAALVFYGGAGGVDGGLARRIIASDASRDDSLGGSVAFAGDIDADGYFDILIGSHGDDDGGSWAGAAYTYPGSAETVWYADTDGDGFGDAEVSQRSSPQPEAHVEDDTDCDDTDASVYPEAGEVSGDGVDSDCDGRGGPEDDDDGDGLSWTEEQALGTSDASTDSDGDGLGDWQELHEHGTDPADPDSDGDGVSDGDEVDGGTDPLVADATEGGGAGSKEGSRGCATTGGGGSGWLGWLGLGLLVRRRWVGPRVAVSPTGLVPAAASCAQGAERLCRRRRPPGVCRPVRSTSRSMSHQMIQFGRSGGWRGWFVSQSES